MNRCVVLFVEGETEVEFYKKLLSYVRNKAANKRLDASIECVNVKGVGGFKNIALRKFEKQIRPKYIRKGGDCEFVIVLCRDTDVFEFSPKPPINWEDVTKEFKKIKVISKVIDIKAKHSIEDWFLVDLEGILKYLKLPLNTKAIGGNGYKKMQNLFGKSNKMYYKGKRSNNFIESLNFEKIINDSYIKTQLAGLFNELNIH